KIYAYNIMLGAFQSHAEAACAADLARCADIAASGASVGQTSFFTGSGWAPPPIENFGARYGGQPPSALNYSTHMTNYQGGKRSAYGDVVRGTYVQNPYVPDVVFGPGQVGKWQTKSDSMEDGIIADVKYHTLTAGWDITDNLNLEVILSKIEQDRRQVIDFDGTEFIITTDDVRETYDSETIELHLSGSALNDRISWLAGYYSLKEDVERRTYRWAMWDFVVPGPVQITNGSAAPPQINVAATEYVRQTAMLLGLNGITGGNLLTGDATIPGATGNANRYPWYNGGISNDQLVHAFD